MASLSPPEMSLISEAMMSSYEKLQSQLPAGKLKMSFTTPDGHQTLVLKGRLGNEGEQVVLSLPTRPATTFHGLMKLPVEIQVKIWKLSFLEPRIFRLCPDPGRGVSPDWHPVVVSHKPPISSQACHLSRWLYRKETNLALGVRNGRLLSLRVSPSRDIIYWDLDDRGYKNAWGYENDCTNRIRSFENVAVNLSRDRGSMEKLFDKLFRYNIFPDMRNLIFVVRRKPLPNTDDVTFFDIRKPDKKVIYFDNSGYIWKDLKEMINKILRPWSYLSKTLDIRAVEVAPIRPQDD